MHDADNEATDSDRAVLTALLASEWLSYDGRLNPDAVAIIARHRIASVEAADAIERLEAEAIAMTTYRENLRDECWELLAKVERLEAENAKLRDALRAAYDDTPGWCDTARAALKG